MKSCHFSVHFIFFCLGTLKTSRTKKSTKEIGDMGFGGEELLLGGRLFPILDNVTEREFKVFSCRSFDRKKLRLLQITGLRLDFHEQSSIACSKYVLDVNLIKNLFDLDQLKSNTCCFSTVPLLPVLLPFRSLWSLFVEDSIQSYNRWKSKERCKSLPHSSNSCQASKVETCRIRSLFLSVSTRRERFDWTRQCSLSLS